MIRRWLFQQIDIASLAFFRVWFGILAFGELLGVTLYHHWWGDHYASDKFHFHYTGFHWVHPLPEPWMSIYLLTLWVAAWCIILGYRYRFFSLYFAIGFTYSFLLEKSYYLNHGYLFCVFSFLMALLPAHRAFSRDVLRRPSIRLRSIPRISLLPLPLGMGIVYFFGGIAKLNGDWLRGIPMLQWLQRRGTHPLDHFFWLEHLGLGKMIHYLDEKASDLMQADWLAHFLSIGGVAFDLFIPFLLLHRRTRLAALFIVLFFHFTNFLIFNIGIFPFLSIGLTALFFPADFPRRIIRRLAHRYRWVRGRVLAWYRQLRRRPYYWRTARLEYSRPRQNLLMAVLALYILYHVCMPLRHWLYPGDVAWTEEGHRFAWRMMLRSKQGYGHFILKDPVRGIREKVKPRQHLTHRQAYKMCGQPGMIHEFAQQLASHYRQVEGWDSVEVYAHIKTRLNYGPYIPYTDTTVNLAATPWKPFGHEEWILPLPKDYQTSTTSNNPD